MHTWWTGTGEGPNPVTPPEVHQRNLQMRRQRRRELQKSSYDLTPVDDGEPDNTDLQSQRDADYTDRQKGTSHVKLNTAGIDTLMDFAES